MRMALWGTGMVVVAFGIGAGIGALAWRGLMRDINRTMPNGHWQKSSAMARQG